MPYAPDGRLLSPGEVYEEAPVQVKVQEWTEDLNVLLICPDCQEVPPNLVENFSVGDTICGSCGRVLSERNLDYRSEWRTFSNDDQGNDDPSRVGDAANPLLHGSQLQTEIAFGDASARHRDLSRAQSKSNHDQKNKGLQQAYGQISVLCESFQIAKPVAETAKLLYKMTDDGRVFKGKSQDAVIAGCIFIACRQHDMGRSFREIYKLTKVSKKEIGRTFKILENYLQQQMKLDNGPKLARPGDVTGGGIKKNMATSASELIIRACSKLGLESSNSMIAQACATRVTELGTAAGRSPLSITGACIYLIANLMGQPKTPKDIGLAVDVSDGTIRTAYKLIHADRERVIDQKWLDKGGDMSRLPPA